MPLRTRQKIMVAVHNGPQAASYSANCWTFKSLYRYAKYKLGVDITYAGAVRPPPPLRGGPLQCSRRSDFLRERHSTPVVSTMTAPPRPAPSAAA